MHYLLLFVHVLLQATDLSPDALGLNVLVICMMCKELLRYALSQKSIIVVFLLVYYSLHFSTSLS
jgi:hypothetical protein